MSVCYQKNALHMCALKKKRLLVSWKVASKRQISLGYFHLSKRRLELFPTVYSPHNVYIYIVRTHIEEVYVHAKQLARTVKSARLFSTRAKCLAKTRARILYLIWHLFNRREETKESRVISNSKKELQLSRSMAREAVMRRGSAQQVRFYCSRAFLLRSSRKRADEMRERQRWFKTSGSCHPICQSKCPFKNLRSERKKINTRGF